MDRELLEERKRQIEALFGDPAYRPMKVKEMAILLDIPKSRRNELQEVLDALVAEGRPESPKRESTESRTHSPSPACLAEPRRDLAL